MADVVAAFDTAPVTNPDATLGIRLHVHIDEQVALHADAQRIALTPCTGLATSTGDADFDTLKDAKFGTPDDRANLNRLNARNWAYHYGIWAHNQTPIPPSATNTSSGCAEQPGNDFIVTMGSWTPDTTLNTATGHTGGVGSRSEQAGTFMHELGHNLNLRHGGGDPRPASQVLLELNKPYVDTNCKPNYMSVMNYTYQVANTVADRLLSYSSAQLVTLREGDLDEGGQGIGLTTCPGGAATCSIAFGPPSGFPAKPTLVSALGGISWNPPDADILDLNIKRDLNNITSASGACPASGGTNPTDILDGFNDWANIQLNFRASTDFAGGVGLTFETDKQHGNEELTREEHLTISRDVCDIKSADKKNNNTPTSSPVFNATFYSRNDNGTVVDATHLDKTTLTLAGFDGTWSLVATISKCSNKDVNRDGLLDLACQFDVPQGTSITPGAVVCTGTIPELDFPPNGYDFVGSSNVQ